MASLRILHVASEAGPWAQTGGLGEVAASLPAAQAQSPEVARALVLAPYYRSVHAQLALGNEHVCGAATIELGDRRVRVRALRHPAHPHVAWLDVPQWFDRDGIYGPTGGGEWDDNYLRFGGLCRAAVALAPQLLDGPPALIHGHDWQGALAAYFARKADIASAVTIHNLAFRGIVGKHAVTELGLPWEDFTIAGFEFWDQLSLLKAGLTAADVVTTVSPSYAREILSPPTDEGFGGVLTHHVSRLVGILNGIDEVSWDPSTDPQLAAAFSAENLTGRSACRTALLHEVRLPDLPGHALAAVVSRMTYQKGLDLVAGLGPDLAALGAQLVVLGGGEPRLEAQFRALAEAYPDHVAVRRDFEAGLARRIYAGADLYLMPSRFEPCGLGQLFAMRYGCVPVVRAVGGLVDTVTDSFPAAGLLDNGFRFEHDNLPGLRWAFARAVDEWRNVPSRFAARQACAMARPAGWKVPAAAYLAEYQAALVRRSGP